MWTNATLANINLHFYIIISLVCSFFSQTNVRVSIQMLRLGGVSDAAARFRPLSYQRRFEYVMFYLFLQTLWSMTDVTADNF